MLGEKVVRGRVVDARSRVRCFRVQGTLQNNATNNDLYAACEGRTRDEGGWGAHARRAAGLGMGDCRMPAFSMRACVLRDMGD